jgi:hypothetical protein
MSDSPQETADRRPTLRRVVVALAQLVAVGVGLKYGFDFGQEISGTALGVVLAINTALFGAMMVGMVTDWVFKPRGAQRTEP